MGEFPTFLYAIGSHWVLLMSGTVSVGIAIYQNIKDKTLERKAFWIIGALCIFLACFLAWKDQHQIALAASEHSRTAEEELQKEKSSKGANLFGVMEQMSLAYSPELEGMVAVFEMSVHNTGYAPSIAERFTLKAVSQDKTFTAQLMGFPEEISFTDTDRNRKYTIHHSELLYEKTMKPIAAGDMTRGWLMFRFPGVNFKLIGFTNAKWTISFLDVAGRLISTSVVHDASSPSSMETFQYEPGTEYPLKQ